MQGWAQDKCQFMYCRRTVRRERTDWFFTSLEVFVFQLALERPVGYRGNNVVRV